MATPEGFTNIDPAAIAVAEVRARQSGLSLKSWLEQLVFRQGAAQFGHHDPDDVGAVVAAAESWLPWSYGSLPVSSMLRSNAPHNIWTDLQLDFSLASPSSSADSPTHLEAPPDASNSALRLIALFPSRIDSAAILLSAAFSEGAVADFRPGSVRRKPAKQASHYKWYSEVVHTCIHRSREVRNALVHHWEPKGRAERLAIGAFAVLCDLTPASQELVALCRHDRSRAFSELAKQLDVITLQFELSANLLAEVEAIAAPHGPSDEQRFAELRTALLEKAGGGLSLTDAASWLGITRQALHKRIKSGSALGMMNGAELVLPRAQWSEVEGKPKFLPGLDEVIKLFVTAGGWSALQFLVESDPNLATTPLAALLEGRIEQVVNAARAYLDADEE